MACWCDMLLYALPFIGFVLFVLSRLIRWNYSYWHKKGVLGPKPTFMLGNLGPTLLGKKSLGENFMDIYFKTKDLPHAGAYMLMRRTWVVNDLELIKTILVKDFAHFTDHSSLLFNEKVEPLSAHLFNLTGEKWKKLRNKLSPTFTSSKIRYMFDTVAQCSTELISHLSNRDLEEPPMDVKDLMAKFNTDVIGSCAFGLDCNSFKYPDTEFRRMGRKVFELGFWKSFIQLSLFFMPRAVSLINFSILGDEMNQFFYDTVDKTIKYREDNKIVRNDFMQLLIQLKNDGFIEDNESGRICYICRNLYI